MIRVKVPFGVKLMPHRHPEDRIYTVMSGVFYIGLGDQFDGDKVEAYPPGSVIVLPGDTSHFHWAKSGEYVTQVTAIGPLASSIWIPADDPRKIKGNKNEKQEFTNSKDHAGTVGSALTDRASHDLTGAPR